MPKRETYLRLAWQAHAKGRVHSRSEVLDSAEDNHHGKDQDQIARQAHIV